MSDTAIAFLMMHSRKISEYNRNLLFIRDYKNLWQERKIHNKKENFYKIRKRIYKEIKEVRS